MADVADRDGFPQGRRGAGKTGRGSRRSRCCKPNLHSFAPSRLRAKPSRWCECFARGREDAKDLGGEAMRQICPFDKSTGEPRALRIGRAGVWHHGPRMDGGGHPRQVPARWFDMESPVEGNPWPREQRSTRRGAVAKPPEVLRVVAGQSWRARLRGFALEPNAKWTDPSPLPPPHRLAYCVTKSHLFCHVTIAIVSE